MVATREQVEVLKDVVRRPYAWPGGYEKVLIMDDGGVLCGECAKNEYKIILHSTRGEYRDGWQVSGVMLADDYDGELYCDHCYKDINAIS